MSDETSGPEPQPVDQAAVDQADEAAGYRVVVDEEEVADLPDSDPNVAAAAGDCEHENHIGDETDHDPLAGAAQESD